MHYCPCEVAGCSAAGGSGAGSRVAISMSRPSSTAPQQHLVDSRVSRGTAVTPLVTRSHHWSHRVYTGHTQSIHWSHRVYTGHTQSLEWVSREVTQSPAVRSSAGHILAMVWIIVCWGFICVCLDSDIYLFVSSMSITHGHGQYFMS